MNEFIHGVVRSVAESLPLPGPVLEIGSYQVAGQESIADLRPLFAGRRYVGVDMRPGPGVDEVASVECLPQEDASVGTVLALNTFEHVAHFWRGFDEIYRVLRPDGALLVSCPFYFHIHSYPSDYWRFTPEALKVLLQDYPAKLIGWHGTKNRPLHVWAVAFRERFPAVSADQLNQYRELLGNYARQPLSPIRRLRYRARQLLCGRRPFAPYLEQENWESEFHQSSWTKQAHERHQSPTHAEYRAAPIDRRELESAFATATPAKTDNNWETP